MKQGNEGTPAVWVYEMLHEGQGTLPKGLQRMDESMPETAHP